MPREQGSRAVLRHVLFVQDFVGEFPHIDKKYEHLFEDDNPPELEALVAKLPATAVVFEFTEPARGGGHDGSRAAVAVDFAEAGVQEGK